MSARLWRYGPALQATFILFALWFVLGGPSGRARAPLRFNDVSLVALGDVKAGWDTGRWWAMPELATADRNADPLLVASYAHVDYFFVHAAHVISRGVPAVVSLAWALMLVVAGASASWCLRRLGVSVEGAWAAGILFALSPFALMYNTERFGLSQAFLPFALFAALSLGTGRTPAPADRDWRIVIAGNVLIALNSIYYAWFSILIVAVGTLAGCVRTKRMASLRSGAAVLFGLALALTINIATTHKTLDNGVLEPVHTDRPSDSELFSLKLRRLVTPIPDHWIAPLREWTARDNTADFPAVAGRTELGLVGALGLVGLMVVLFIPSAAGPGDAGESLRAASRLNLAVLLVGMTGGFGSVFTALFAPQLTNYALLTPFVAFLALISISLFIDRLGTSLRWWRTGIWALVLVIGLTDHVVAIKPVMAARADVADESQGIRDVIVALEQRLPHGSLVAQVPVQAEPLQQGKMHAFDQLKPYVLSRTLRWTFPATTPEAQKWLEDMISVDPADLIARLRQDGVSAIVIDRLAYRDGGAALLATLAKSLSTTEPVMPHNRYVALDIRDR